MKRTLREWIVVNNLDAVVSLNRDPDEVVLAQPRSAVRLVSALAL